MAQRHPFPSFPLSPPSEKEKALEIQKKQAAAKEEEKVLQGYFKNEETYRNEFAFYFNSIGAKIAPAANLSKEACAQFISNIFFGDSSAYLDRNQIGFGWLSLNSRIQEKLLTGQATTRIRAMDMIIADDLKSIFEELSGDQKHIPKATEEPPLRPSQLARLHSGEYHFTDYQAQTKVNFAARCALGTYDPTWKHHDHSEVQVKTVKPGTKEIYLKAHPNNEKAPRLYAKDSYEIVMHLTEEKEKVVVSHIKSVNVKAVVPVIGEIDLTNCEIGNQKIPVNLTFHHDKPDQIGLSSSIVTNEVNFKEMKASESLKKVGEKLLSWFAAHPVTLQGTFVTKSAQKTHRPK